MIIYDKKGEISGTPLSEYGATLIERNISPVTTVPNSFPPRPATKVIQLKFLFKGNNELEIAKNISRLNRALLRAEIEFTDAPNLRTPIEGADAVAPVKVNNNAYTVEMNFAGEMTYNNIQKKSKGTGNSIPYNNEGTWESPFKLRFTVMTTTDDLQVIIGDVVMRFTNLKMGNVVTIDTLEMRILLNGGDNIGIMTSSIFPSLPLGEGTIQINQEVHYQMEYREVWM